MVIKLHIHWFSKMKTIMILLSISVIRLLLYPSKRQIFFEFCFTIFYCCS